MPRNSSGTFTLATAAFVAGTTIKSADVNSDLSDIGTAITQSLATTGVSSMTGPVKLAAGTAAAPSLTLAADITSGFYNSAAGTFTYVTSGTAIWSVGPSGVTATDMTVANLTVTGSFSVAANRIVGEMVDYGGTAAPSLWLLCYGQAISRTTYASLFAAIGIAFGAGDASTTFNLPDLRGRATIGKDDMGGVAANRITTAGCGIDGITLGAVGGEQTHTLITAELPVVTPAGSISPNPHHHTSGGPNTTKVVQSGSGVSVVDNSGVPDTGNTSLNFSGTPFGSGTAHNTVQPGQIVNKIIYAAV